MVGKLLLAVDIEFEVTGALHVDDILTSLLRGEGGLVFGREVLNGQIRCKDVHTCCGYIHGFRVVFSSESLALHLSVVPERTFQTLLAVGRHALCCQMALHHLVVGQVTAGDIEELLLFGFDTVEDGDGVVRCSVVVTPHHGYIVGIGTDHCYLLLSFLQGEDVILVLQQYDGLTGHVKGYLGRCLGGHGRIGNLRPLNQRRIIHLTEVKTSFEQTDDMLVNLSLRDESAAHGLRNTPVGIAVATLHVGTGQCGLGRGGDGG